MNIMTFLSSALVTCVLLANARAADTAATAAAGATNTETKEQRDARMAWWREAKFGMFIHWGVYAVPAGTYKGKQIGGIGEWIMRNAQIPVAEYRAFARQFNPVKYEPDAWAKLAKEAGMRYMVITSKHHDGFALFPSEATEWDIADATPYGKDLIGPLAEAARAEGLKFGLYYSQAQDWTHPGGAKAGSRRARAGTTPTRAASTSTSKKIAVPQVREILTRYQPDILWWDTPTWMTTERADRCTPCSHCAPASSQQPPRRRLQGRHRDPRAAHPRHRLQGPRLGNLHDHERHLGLQELRPQLEIHRRPSSATSSTSSARAATTCSTSGPTRRRRDPAAEHRAAAGKSARG